MSVADGWYGDPFGIHQLRYYTAGAPTGHVCDGHQVSYELPPPPETASTGSSSRVSTSESQSSNGPGGRSAAELSTPGQPPALPEQSRTAHGLAPVEAASQAQAEWSTYWVDSTPSNPIRDPRKPWQVFSADLSWSARAILKSPGVLLWTVGWLIAVQAVIHTPVGVAILLALLIGIFGLGFVGMQRVWFVHLLRGTRPPRWRDVWSLSFSFVGRFFLLGVLVTVACIPFGIVAVVLSHPAATGGTTRTTFETVVFILITLAIDVALTFVLPALALSFRSVTTALSVGLRLIRRTWPQSLWYVLAPGLTATVFASALPGSAFGSWLVAVFIVVGGVLALWFKGATVAFYVRAFPKTPTLGSSGRRDLPDCSERRDAYDPERAAKRAFDVFDTHVRP